MAGKSRPRILEKIYSHLKIGDDLMLIFAGFVLIALILMAMPAKVILAAGSSGPSSSSTIYGSGIGMDSLNNTQIGGTDAQSSSYRFRATATSALNSIQIYIIGPNHPGYGAGTGGTFEATVQTDDGTSNHAPSGTVLSRTTFVPVGGLPLITFPSPATLTSGQLYHIVFRNIDPSPAANFASLDGIFMYQPTVPRQPLVNDVDWGQPLKYSGGGWQDRNNTIPIMQLNYADGSKAGVGYMEVWVRSYKIISGSGMAREAFTVSGSDKTVSSVSVRIMRDSGTSPLSVRLETSNGTLMEKGTIPSSSIAIGTPGDNGGGSTWAAYTFNSPQTLKQGQSYNLVFSAASDTQYSIFIIRKGIEYTFAPTTYFSDGHGQYNPGTGWVAFDQDGGTKNLDEGDLQFYFNTSAVSNPTPTPISCSTSLQSQIDAAASGSTLNLTGCTYSGTATIAKPLTLLGATLMVPAGSTGLIVTASNVTLDGIHVIGTQASTFNANEYGIVARGASAAAPIQNFTIRNSEVGQLGGWGIEVQYASNSVLKNNNIHDAAYAGIMILSGQGGQISGNAVQRVGYNVANLPGPNNSYGISLSRTVNGDFTTNPPTSNFTVTNNTIADVPVWHALDTHAGQNITFSNNTVSRASRAIFITTDSADNRPTNILVTGNLFGSPSPVTFNLVAVTAYDSLNTTITNNNWSAGWNGNYFEDYENLSTGLIVSNNNIGESLPSPTPSPSPTPTGIVTPTPTPRPTATPTPTPTPIPPTPTPSVFNQGGGLLGMYYANRNLSGLPLSRIDSGINFNWGRQGSPITGISGTNFSVRWAGYVVPLYSENYTFYATADDGARVWVNGTQIINAWYDHSTKTYTGNISLLANHKYSLKVEYYQRWGYDLVNLKWSSASTPKTIIPQSQLYTYN